VLIARKKRGCFNKPSNHHSNNKQLFFCEIRSSANPLLASICVARYSNSKERPLLPSLTHFHTRSFYIMLKHILTQKRRKYQDNLMLFHSNRILQTSTTNEILLEKLLSEWERNSTNSSKFESQKLPLHWKALIIYFNLWFKKLRTKWWQEVVKGFVSWHQLNLLWILRQLSTWEMG